MITIPPPRPVREPKNPAMMDPSQINIVNSNIFIVYVFGYFTIFILLGKLDDSLFF
jgi:hypothetical protein